LTAKDADKRPDVAAFSRAMEEGKPGTTDLFITATFTGRFVCTPASSSSASLRVIYIEAVKALEVTRTKNADSVDPKTGNLHLTIPRVATTKPDH
jgi:hypothetical protein